MNEGFLRTSGDLVLFIDSDDFLYLHACAVIADRWQRGCSKLHFPLYCIAADGRDLNIVKRAQPLDTGEVSHKLLTVGYQISASMSGNVWDWRVLKKILPMPEEEFRISADDYLNTLAPFYGPVTATFEPSAHIALHDASNWSTALYDSTCLYPMIRQRLIGKHPRVRLIIEEANAQRLATSTDLLFRDFSYIRLRLISLRGAQMQHLCPSDTGSGLFWRGIKAVMKDPYLSLPRKLNALVSFLLFALCPRSAIPSTTFF